MCCSGCDRPPEPRPGTIVRIHIEDRTPNGVPEWNLAVTGGSPARSITTAVSLTSVAVTEVA